MCRHGHCRAGSPCDQRQTSNELTSQRQHTTRSGSATNTAASWNELLISWWGWRSRGRDENTSGWLGYINVKGSEIIWWLRKKNKQKAIRLKTESQVHCQKYHSMSSISNVCVSSSNKYFDLIQFPQASYFYISLPINKSHEKSPNNAQTKYFSLCALCSLIVQKLLETRQIVTLGDMCLLY